MSARVRDADQALVRWKGVRRDSRLRDNALDVLGHGLGHYRLAFDFGEAGVVAASGHDPIGPSADPEALQRAVDAANAEMGEGTFVVDGVYVTTRQRLDVGPEGILVEDLEACRQRLIARLDAYHAAFEAPGREPFGVHVGDDGVARVVPRVSGR